jgi:rhodanese-related sulfurtransferase
VTRSQTGDDLQSASVPGAYAGDISPREAWERLSGDPASVLVDVRTRAEWVFVGTPDCSSLSKKPIFIEWQSLPSMAPNPAFVEELAAALAQIGTGSTTPVFFLCRSGARSLSAARACTAAGFEACFNIASGFEGDLDSHGHRATIAGWKYEGLAWKQG